MKNVTLTKDYQIMNNCSGQNQTSNPEVRLLTNINQVTPQIRALCRYMCSMTCENNQPCGQECLSGG